MPGSEGGDPPDGDQTEAREWCLHSTMMDDLLPVILTQEAEAIWLDPTVQEPATLLPLLKPYPAEEMKLYPVSTWVNNPAHDGPACVEAAPERRKCFIPIERLSDLLGSLQFPGALF